METGTLEKKTIPESNNPFKNSAADSTELGTGLSKNPFVVETHSNNPFLLRLTSPLLSNRAPLRPIANEQPVENSSAHLVSEFLFKSFYILCVVFLFLLYLMPTKQLDFLFIYLGGRSQSYFL